MLFCFFVFVFVLKEHSLYLASLPSAWDKHFIAGLPFFTNIQLQLLLSGHSALQATAVEAALKFNWWVLSLF